MWKKYCGVGWATDDRMAHARCMLNNYDTQQQTLTIWLYERASTVTLCEGSYIFAGNGEGRRSSNWSCL